MIRHGVGVAIRRAAFRARQFTDMTAARGPCPVPRLPARRNSMSLATRPLAPTVPNDLEAFFVPFTPNRAFKKAPRLIARAKDMHYITVDGRKVIDGSAGMWCCNAGHNRDPIVAAIQQQAAELDYPP